MQALNYDFFPCALHSPVTRAPYFFTINFGSHLAKDAFFVLRNVRKRYLPRRSGPGLGPAAVHLRASSGKGLRCLISPTCFEASCVCIKKKNKPQTTQPVPNSLVIGIPGGKLPAEQSGPAGVTAHRALRALS